MPSKSFGDMRTVQVLRKLDPAEWGGTETAMQRLFQGLQEQGITPVVYCPRLKTRKGEGRFQPDGDPDLLPPGCQVRRFRAFVPVLGLSRERKRQLVSVGGNLMSFQLLASLWREPGVSLIHTHTLGRIGGIALTVAKRRHLPLVVSIHGGVLDLPEALKKSFNAPLDQGWEWGRVFGLLFRARHLFQEADAIVTCNASEARLLKERYPSKRVVVQPHAVPIEVYRADQRVAAQAAFPQIRGRQVLLCLGRVDPVKNQGWLLEQAPAFFRRHPQTLLVLAGPCTDEPYGQHLAQIIRDGGMADRVLLTGGMPPNDPRLIGLLQEAAVVVVPSVSETFGLVVLEAWAAGAPVIASRASGPAALVRHGENGWLFDLDQPQAFHAALDQVLENPALAKAAARQGMKVCAQFTPGAIAEKVKELYMDLTSRN